MVMEQAMSLRGAIDFYKEQGDVLVAKEEVDPVYDISGIQKHFENGPVILFEKIKGYPGVRDVGNVFGREERMASIFGIDDHRALKFHCLDAIKNPLPPNEVTDAPCQEVVITKDIDVMSTIPIIKHTEEDAGRILGGGNTLVCGEYFKDGSHISFNRMHFRGKDWSSISLNLSSHLEWLVLEKRGGKIPMTINIGAPPAVLLTAGGGMVHSIISAGSDELGIAGGIQGAPVDIVKAKTVDAYSVANSEWVIEGYVDTKQTVWESEECETLGDNVPIFFAEYTGYVGRARKTYKFQVTAITHRKDPIFYTPLASSFDGDNLCKPVREACFYEIGESIVPGFVLDVNILHSLKSWAGVIFQVHKRRKRDEGYQRNLITAMLGCSPGLRLVVAVDEDIDIYNAEDVIWAITTRLDPGRDLITPGGGRGLDNFPIEKGGAVAESVFEGGIGLDATIPMSLRWRFKQSKHPTDLVDLEKWFSPEQIASGKAVQCEYAKLMTKRAC